MPDKKSDRPIAKPRKGADEARRGEHTGDLLNALRHFAAIADSRGRLQFADEAAPRALGYEPADILRKPFWEASWFGPSPESQHAIKEGLREAVAGEKAHCQVEAFTKEGMPVPVTFNITSLKGAEGSIVSIVAQVDPLDEDEPDAKGYLQQLGKLDSSTDRKKAEAALQEADKRYHALFDNPLNIVFVNDGRGTILDANDAALSRFGFSRETLGTMRFQDIVHPEDFPAAAQALAQVMAKGCLEEPIQVRALSKSGDMIWIEVCGFPIEQNEHGYRGLAVARDITDRKKAEESLRKSEERYRLVADNATDTIWTTDMNLKFTFLSSVKVRSLGYTDEEIKNLRVDQLIPPTSLPKALQAFKEGLDLELSGRGDPNRIMTLEHEMILKGGTLIWVEAKIRFLHNEQGQPIGILGVTRDITERKRAAEALRQSEAKLKDLVEKLKLSQEALSTPVVQMWDKVLALPLIGVIDDQRAQRIMEVVLRKIVETQSEVLIMDVTGVASMDTTVTNHILQTVQSASMLGAQCILTGIRPDVAHSVTNLGMDMSKVIVKRDLQDGLRWALHNLGYGIQARSR